MVPMSLSPPAKPMPMVVAPPVVMGMPNVWTHESLKAAGINGIEYEKRLGQDRRRDTKALTWVAAASGVTKIEQCTAALERNILTHRRNYAASQNMREEDVNAKIGCAQEVVMHETQANQCYRYRDQGTYPSGGMYRGVPTERIYAKNEGQVVLCGVEHTKNAAVLEAHGARYNGARQKVKLNLDDTAEECEITHGEPSSVENPSCIYMQFVRRDVPIDQIEQMIARHKQFVAEQLAKQRLEDAAALLRLAMPDGGEATSDDQAIAEVFAQRKKRNIEAASAAGSAPKSQSGVRRKSHPRFTPGVKCLTFPKSVLGVSSASDVSADHPRVVWEVEQIYNHLYATFGPVDSANKMDYLTLPATPPFKLKTMKDNWDIGFPTYTNAPCTAMKAALTSFWAAKTAPDDAL